MTAVDSKAESKFKETIVELLPEGRHDVFKAISMLVTQLEEKHKRRPRLETTSDRIRSWSSSAQIPGAPQKAYRQLPTPAPSDEVRSDNEVRNTTSYNSCGEEVCSVLEDDHYGRGESIELGGIPLFSANNHNSTDKVVVDAKESPPNDETAKMARHCSSKQKIKVHDSLRRPSNVKSVKNVKASSLPGSSGSMGAREPAAGCLGSSRQSFPTTTNIDKDVLGNSESAIAQNPVDSKSKHCRQLLPSPMPRSPSPVPSKSFESLKQTGPIIISAENVKIGPGASCLRRVQSHRVSPSPTATLLFRDSCDDSSERPSKRVRFSDKTNEEPSNYKDQSTQTVAENCDILTPGQVILGYGSWERARMSVRSPQLA